MSIDFLRWLLGSAGEVCHTSSADVEDGQAGCNVQVVALSELLDDLEITEEEVRDTHFWSIDVEGAANCKCFAVQLFLLITFLYIIV